MDILKRVLKLLAIYILLVGLNIISFAYLYYQHCVIVNSNWIEEHIENSQSLYFHDALYFSGITYLTIGYGDITAVDQLGKFLTVLQGFSGVIINSTFTGMFLYYLVKRPRNIIITNKIFIRYKDNNDRFYLSVRVGNKGRALVNVNRVLEVFEYEESNRKRILHMAQQYHYFEKLLYWDIDLHDEKNKELLDYLKAAIYQDKNILIRISIIGTDIEGGEFVFVSRYYTRYCIHFIREYIGLYEWQSHKRSTINWNDFNKTCRLDDKKIQDFKNL
ncbi:potassium channel family protein [Natronincola ferrireducens]|uniref:Ion channel n=1 Tax=Natronincola ferrireducens TaxID=393762 RepID=A0A1G8ZE08_9FIRM|nr:potassium channel family protein [Natronincola ferrireducens]SDK13267.1 Ion channel [Natronincola ferrireducens]